MAGNLKLVGKIADVALDMLKKTCQALENNTIDYILEGGTLLGIIREERLLPWDNDLDITVKYEDLDKILKARKDIWKAGYRTRVRHYKEDIGPFKKGQVKIIKVQTRKLFFFKGFTLLDIFVKKRVDGKYYWTVGGKNIVLKSAPEKFYKELSKVDFKGHDYSIPKDYKEYLTYRYGQWNIVKKDYNYKKDDNAIVK